MQVNIQLTHESVRVTVTLQYYGLHEIKQVAWGLFSVRSMPDVYLGNEPGQVTLHVADRTIGLDGVYQRAGEVERAWVKVLNEVERHAELHRLVDEIRRPAALVDQATLVAGSN